MDRSDSDAASAPAQCRREGGKDRRGQASPFHDEDEQADIRAYRAGSGGIGTAEERVSQHDRRHDAQHQRAGNGEHRPPRAEQRAAAEACDQHDAPVEEQLTDCTAD